MISLIHAAAPSCQTQILLLAARRGALCATTEASNQVTLFNLKIELYRHHAMNALCAGLLTETPLNVWIYSARRHLAESVSPFCSSLRIEFVPIGRGSRTYRDKCTHRGDLAGRVVLLCAPVQN